jgi:hypothetical protein
LQRVDLESAWRCASRLRRSSQSTTVPSMQTRQVPSCLIAAQERGIGCFAGPISLNSGVHFLAPKAAHLPNCIGIVVEMTLMNGGGQTAVWLFQLYGSAPMRLLVQNKQMQAESVLYSRQYTFSVISTCNYHVAQQTCRREQVRIPLMRSVRRQRMQYEIYARHKVYWTWQAAVQQAKDGDVEVMWGKAEGLMWERKAGLTHR